MPRFKNGIEMESELKAYQEKARKWDAYKKLVDEERECRSRIKSLAQKQAKMLRD